MCSDTILKQLIYNKDLRLYVNLEQVRRIELPSQPWQGRILAVEPHLHLSIAFSSTDYLIIPKKLQDFK